MDEFRQLAHSANRMIARQREAEDSLQNTHALLMAAIEQSPSGIVIADAPDVRIRSMNSAALRILGLMRAGCWISMYHSTHRAGKPIIQMA